MHGTLDTQPTQLCAVCAADVAGEIWGGGGGGGGLLDYM